MIYFVATLVRPNQSQAIEGIGVDLLHSLELRASAGQFTVPPYVLSSLPASPSDITALTAAGSAPQNRFKAPGLDLGYFSFCSPSSALCGGGFFDYYWFLRVPSSSLSGCLGFRNPHGQP